MVILKNDPSPTGNPVQTRDMGLSDMDSLMRIKNAEGWNQIVGTVCAINYAHTVAWIGMMLVDKDFRGRGISKLLLNEVILKLEKCTSIKLDATPAGRPVYLKFGFKDEYTLYRMTHPSVSRIPLNKGSLEAMQVRSEDLLDLAEFDKLIFGAQRASLIRHLYENYPELAWLIRENNKVVGYCLGRRGENFTQIGPVYGSSEMIARSLIRSAINSISGEAVVVDIPAIKTSTMRWLKGCGFTSLRPFERMYLYNNPYPGNIGSQYLICGPELG